ncbi:DNA primase [Blattabacterium cuenoti]|uniref:DNA primase n=1 Tax=Blattabacterium cuenoti TaxID=1653831 RepID=UPI00163D3BC0|nr:DNA primase [Blattabacterium cuenoti]
MVIPKNIKEKILYNSRIEDVIGELIPLKKSGVNYRGLSPFSQEKNPSFIVSPVKKIWKDFSSGKGGDVINFLMEYEHFTYLESLRYLANKYDIKIEEKNSFFYKNKYNKLFYIQNYAKSFFIHQLFFNQEGIQEGLSYLQNDRGFYKKTIHKFELGYAINSWKNFMENSLKKGFRLNDLIKLGLVFCKKSKYFDYFRKRIIFPIHNLNGQVVGFGGRNTNNSDYFNVKYINSPNNDIFKKSKILYGLFQSKIDILKKDTCYMVEGYTDVISLYQSGIKNVVSTSGISITVNQIILIKQFTKNITIFYDGDISGIKASLKIINILLKQNINLKILFLSNGEDPDSISKKYSPYNLKIFLKENSYNFISFKQKVYEKYHNDNDLIKKSLLIFNILNSLSKLDNEIQKELYIQELSRIFRISEKVLFFELEKLKSNKKTIKNTFFLKKNTLIPVEEELIQILIIYGEKKVKESNNKTIFDMISYYFKCWNIRFLSEKNQKIFEKIYNKEKNHIFKIKIRKNIFLPDKNLEIYLYEILLRYKSVYISILIKKEIIRYNNIKNKNKKLLLDRIIYLTNLKNKVNKKLHRYV